MNQMNQMNPVLFQQQMIYQMQYRQTNFNNQQRQNQQNKKNYKKNDDQSEDKKPELNSEPDEAQLKSQLEYILKMHQDMNGSEASDPET